MTPNQGLAALMARLLSAIDQSIEATAPELALVQGDTTTVLAAALACFYRNIPVGHVEAGLRTGDIRSPFPEEANRRLLSLLAALHFAPTQSARRALLSEGVSDESIEVTGNTVIDALQLEVSACIGLIGNVADSINCARLPPLSERLEGSPVHPHYRPQAGELRRGALSDMLGDSRSCGEVPTAPLHLFGAPQSRMCRLPVTRMLGGNRMLD